jgi:hypothetical protein
MSEYSLCCFAYFCRFRANKVLRKKTQVSPGAGGSNVDGLLPSPDHHADGHVDNHVCMKEKEQKICVLDVRCCFRVSSLGLQKKAENT